MTGLSGGQAARAGLASLLLSRYDVFLLDEPTNDLDLDGLDRLEGFVQRAARRHRRRQPRPRVPRPDGEPDRRAGPGPAAGRDYGGGYAAYLEERDGRAAARAGGVRRVRRHARRRSRPGPYPARLDGEGRAQRPAQGRPTATSSAGTFRGEASEKQAAKARQTERLIERLDVVEEPRKEWQLRMEIAAAPRAGSGRRHRCGARSSGAASSRSARSTCRSTGPTGSRSPGPNGSGKSTLLGVLLGRIPPA